MKISDPKTLVIGCAVTTCCHRDLVVIKDAEQLNAIVRDWATNGPGFDPDYDGGFDYEAWSSPLEALLELAERWHDGDPGRRECLEMAEKYKTPNLNSMTPPVA